MSISLLIHNMLLSSSWIRRKNIFTQHEMWSFFGNVVKDTNFLEMDVIPFSMWFPKSLMTCHLNFEASSWALYTSKKRRLWSSKYLLPLKYWHYFTIQKILYSFSCHLNFSWNLLFILKCLEIVIFFASLINYGVPSNILQNYISVMPINGPVLWVSRENKYCCLYTMQAMSPSDFVLNASEFYHIFTEVNVLSASPSGRAI